jgi:RHS repeat-associated protein
VRAELLGSRWTQYLTVGGAMVGARFDNVATGAVALRYFPLDHLGSVSVVTYAGGAVAERDSYDSWGKRRHPSGADDPSGSIDSLTTRGFTGQEHLSEVGLIHYNTRLYDPLVGRFTSADSIVPHPGDPQSYDRYAYVRNRPLSAVDPSGHVDFVALPPITIGANWSNYNWSPSVTLGAGSQAYLAAVYGGIYRSALYNAAYYGASILPFAPAIRSRQSAAISPLSVPSAGLRVAAASRGLFQDEAGQPHPAPGARRLRRGRIRSRQQGF